MQGKLLEDNLEQSFPERFKEVLMKRKTLLKVHKKLGFIFAPFFILSSLTAIPLFFRKDDLYSKEIKGILLGIHNWEGGFKYIGIILALALLIMSISGLVLTLKKK